MNQKFVEVVGLKPTNLPDANRTLYQLSYTPDTSKLYMLWVRKDSNFRPPTLIKRAL